MCPKSYFESQHSTSDRTGADRAARACLDWIAFCEALRDRLEGDTLPPEEAYWWTRIALEEVGVA
jgi:hypothetical protein